MNQNDVQQLKVLLATCHAVAETIEEAGSRGIPSGHLYAALMGRMDLDVYNRVIALLVDSGRIKKTSSHVLYSAKVSQ